MSDALAARPHDALQHDPGAASRARARDPHLANDVGHALIGQVLAILGPITHTHVSVHLPAWLHPLLMTPQVHRLHHARALALSSGRFADLDPEPGSPLGRLSAPPAARLRARAASACAEARRRSR